MEHVAGGYGLIEGPVYIEGRGLIYSDVIAGGVYCLNESGQVETLFPHRKGIGGMAAHADGGLVMSGRNIAFKGFADPTTRVLLETDISPEAIGFNDLTTDSEGRIYVGSLAFTAAFPGTTPKPAHLHMIDLDGQAHTLADGIQLTNGLAVAADGTKLYHADSLSNAVWVYDRHADGMVGPRRVFAALGEDVPDGLALAEDGSVWVALANGQAVAVLAPNGTVREKIAVPLPMVTSLCFGGADRRDLFVVTGSRGTDSDRAGSIFHLRTETPGLRVAEARIPVPKSP